MGVIYPTKPTARMLADGWSSWIGTLLREVGRAVHIGRYCMASGVNRFTRDVVSLVGGTPQRSHFDEFPISIVSHPVAVQKAMIACK